MINYQNLEKIGFSEKEAKVYLAALDLGEATIQQLAEKSGVKRVTVYIIIESLMKHGLISSAEKGKKTFFTAENPVNIIRFFDKQKKELRENLTEKEEVLKKITPELESLFKTAGPKLKVRFLQGKEGLRTMRNDLFKADCSEIKGVVELDALFKMFPVHTEETTKKRVAKGIKSKMIYTHPKGPVENATDPNRLREARYIPYDKFEFKGDFSICGNKVWLVSFENNPAGVLIENESIAKMANILFDLAWEAAEKYNKKQKNLTGF